MVSSPSIPHLRILLVPTEVAPCAKVGGLAACATGAMAGGMLGRLSPQSAEEQEAVEAAGLDPRQILTCSELISSNEIFFAATGITDGTLLSGVHYHGDEAETESLVLRGETGTRRFMRAEHRLR